MKTLRILVAIAALSAVASAQLSGLAGTVTPSSAAVGQSINLTVTAYGAPQGMSNLGGTFIIREVRQGSPTGTPVWSPFGFTSPTTLNPGQSLSSAWDQLDDMGNQVAPGDYYLKVNTWGTPTWFHARIEGATSRPTLSEVAPAQIGQAFIMDLTAPLAPNAPYIVAASFTSNTGATHSATEHVSLDQDALFGLTFPSPNPLLFGSLQGTLDGTGFASGIGMFLPPVPALVDVGMKWQAVVLGSGGLETTNTLSVTIQ